MASIDSAAEVSPFNIDDRSTTTRKPLDANRYATKKTIAQGMLDIALLTANASQLKYILQVGEKHEFYRLMVTLISTSIVLQVIAGMFILLLGQTDISKPENRLRAAWLNHLLTAAVTGFLVTDVLKMVFGLETAVQCLDEQCSNLFPANLTGLIRNNFTRLS